MLIEFHDLNCYYYYDYESIGCFKIFFRYDTVLEKTYFRAITWDAQMICLKKLMVNGLFSIGSDTANFLQNQHTITLIKLPIRDSRNHVRLHFIRKRRFPKHEPNSSNFSRTVSQFESNNQMKLYLE